jgi:hypothetical protein
LEWGGFGRPVFLMREFKYIPSFLTAKTKEQLVKKMVERCMRDAISYRFFDIQKDGAEWVAWFYPEKDAVNVKDVL